MTIATNLTTAADVRPYSAPARSASEPAVLCTNVVKRFYRYEHRTRSIREAFVRSVLGRPLHDRRAEFTLRDFSLRVERGEAVALVGGNGSGKSTALRLIAGIYRPSSGTIVTRGRLAAVIELGVGFHPELTGAENVVQYAAALGLSRREVAERFDEIVEFAELDAFIREPVKIYSSGMQARLAFAVAMLSKPPDVLLIDEALSVGDYMFQDKCVARVEDIRAHGGSMVMVSHNPDTILQLCTRALWLEHGSIRMEGPVDEVLDAYLTP
jgi:ABC-type polysaccharide/polyol phosphate transport system ATPase subunit